MSSKSLELEDNTYSKFGLINGTHSLKKAFPKGYVEYSARTRHGGKVFYFNFELAKEMGLIAQSHPDKMNESLSKTLLHTFSLVIINEYDQIHKISYPTEEIRPHKYMATRYLQLQHPSKKGFTSGDGRGIWNGEFRARGVTWDIASTGTGATRLSPAAAIEGKFFKTGDKKVCYGNGRGSLDDSVSAALMSEIFAKNGIPTERILLIIEFDDGSSITVRASKCLLRPSHFFSPLKQNNFEGLKGAIDYFISRQEKNGEWPHIRDEKRRYEFMACEVAKIFSRTAAIFESEYIFCWMDWDGDNILANGGIIDYGSVRQFGLFHHEYRYDDVDRYSTRITEQKNKAKYIVQCFAQIRDFLISGTKKNISEFRKDPILEIFDKNFEKYMHEKLLYKIGFSDEHIQYLMKHHTPKIAAFKQHYDYFEKAKSTRGIYNLPDGITCDAIFCMRDILRELPRHYQRDLCLLQNNDFINLIRSSYARKKDLKVNSSRAQRIKLFQDRYLELIRITAGFFYKNNLKQTLLTVGMRASIRNPNDRITGDGAIWVTDQILRSRKNLKTNEIYKMISALVETQIVSSNRILKLGCSRLAKKVGRTLRIIRDYRQSV